MKGIIFDLDGTLWEVIESSFKSANTVAKKYNLPEVSRDTICRVFGLNKSDSAKLYFPSVPLNVGLKLMDEEVAVNIDNLSHYGGNVYKNLEMTLKKLQKQYELYIVSNTAEVGYIEAFLETSKLKKYFKDWMAAGDLHISKGEAIKKIIHDYHLSAAIYVGDTEKDLEAANIAHIPFVHARYGFGKNLNTKYYINDISELPDLICNNEIIGDVDEV